MTTSIAKQGNLSSLLSANRKSKVAENERYLVVESTQVLRASKMDASHPKDGVCEQSNLRKASIAAP